MATDNSKKLLLISPTGFLGSFIEKRWKEEGREFRGTGRGRCDGLLSLNLEKEVRPQLQEELAKANYTHGIICAAMSDPESCFRNQPLSNRVNVDAMRELFALFREHRVMPVFFSSDLVFDGRGDFYDEEDPMDPPTVYGRQKRKIEEEVRNLFADHLIFRTSKLMSMTCHPRSILSPLLEKMRRGEELKVFSDQYITPVFVEDVAQVLGLAIDSGLKGTFHLANRDRLNRVELAERVSRSFGIWDTRIQPIQLAEIGLSEARGLHNTLSAVKVEKALGFQFLSVDEGLKMLRDRH